MIEFLSVFTGNVEEVDVRVLSLGVGAVGVVPSVVGALLAHDELVVAAPVDSGVLVVVVDDVVEEVSS